MSAKDTGEQLTAFAGFGVVNVWETEAPIHLELIDQLLTHGPP